MRRSPIRLFALACALAMPVAAPALAADPAPAPSASPDVEAQIGARVYAALQSKGELLTTSPLYTMTDPLTAQIKRVADPQYEHPFRFLIVHEEQSRAFAVPGGNVYLSDTLVRATANRDELAGVMCRETAYTIDHDAVNLANDGAQSQSYSMGDLVANIFSGGRGAHADNEQERYDAGSVHFSQSVQFAADAKGAEICAAAGFNPWGSVWQLQTAGGYNSGARISALTNALNSDHARYGRYPSTLDRKAATAAKG